MTTASAQTGFRSLAHRRAVLQHIRATLLPAALAFGVLAPLIGLGLIWGSTFVALTLSAITSGGAVGGAVVAAAWGAILAAYASAALASAISGVWIAVISPFMPENSRFWSGAAIVGMMNAFLFVNVGEEAGIFGGKLFLALTGAVSVFITAWLLKNSILKRDESRRDTLARERAGRLAKERAGA